MRRLGWGSRPLPVKLSVQELRRCVVVLLSASSLQHHRRGNHMTIFATLSLFPSIASKVKQGTSAVSAWRRLRLYLSSRQLRGYRPVVIGVDWRKELQTFVEARSRTDNELHRTYVWVICVEYEYYEEPLDLDISKALL